MNTNIIKRNETRKRRKDMSCKVYKVKIDKSRLSKTSKEHLDTLFREAKRFYNYCITQEDFSKIDANLTEIPVKVGDKYETRTLTVLSSTMRYAIKERLFWSLKSLSTLKKNGKKVGKLKFKSFVNSIYLKQLGETYFVKNKNKIRIQKMKQLLRVRGLDQIPENAETANANLVRKNGDYYLHITTYVPKIKKAKLPTAIGIDFGCETQLSFSNGIKVEFQVEPTKRLKKLDRKINKKKRPKRKTRLKGEKSMKNSQIRKQIYVIS